MLCNPIERGIISNVGTNVEDMQGGRRERRDEEEKEEQDVDFGAIPHGEEELGVIGWKETFRRGK